MSRRQPIRDCKKKVVISMKINNVGKVLLNMNYYNISRNFVKNDNYNSYF